MSLVLLLLLGLAVTSEAAASLCSVNEDGTRCECNIDVIRNPQRFLCFQASEVELKDGKLDESGITFNRNFSFAFIQINKLIFNNLTISFPLMNKLLPFMSLSQVRSISLISSTIEDVQPLLYPALHVRSKIRDFQLNKLTVDPSLLQPSFQVLHRWLFGSLESLSLVDSGLAEIECYWAGMLGNLTHLDLSGNPLTWTSLQSISQCSSLSFKHLTSFRLSGSNLTSLQPLCTLLSLTPALAELDVSRNNFSIFHYPHCLQEVTTLRVLNLSHSGITEVNSLFSTSLEELDLSYNSLEVFNNTLQALKKLDLSNNRLKRLPSLAGLSQLLELRVDNNQLTILIHETGNSLSSLEQLDILHAGRNPYQCDCDLKETVTFLNTYTVYVEDWPKEFGCATPVTQHGTPVMNLPLEMCVNSPNGTPHHSSPLCLMVFIGVLSRLISFR
ncbi:toll-like receptor 2 isoform X2 [Scomber scombrus]|uniref:Monocyte differentiation antigen CD14 n=1 Tax=Scomber scombrus TaxID=13677 RepID=A0AAV1NDS3_SCOSC